MAKKSSPLLTFRKQKALTGLGGIGYPHATVEIKKNKHTIGFIYPPSWQDTKNKDWIISVMVYKNDIMEDGNPNCEWKNLKIGTALSEEDARIRSQELVEKILKTYKLRCLDDPK